MRHPDLKIALAILSTFLGASAATAGVDRASAPSGVYRLKPGIYVQEGVSCTDAPNAAILSYDGIGLSDPQSHACRVSVLARQGNHFSVSQSCIAAGIGEAPRVSDRETVTILDAQTFTRRLRGRGTTYRYCRGVPSEANGRSAILASKTGSAVMLPATAFVGRWRGGEGTYMKITRSGHAFSIDTQWGLGAEMHGVFIGKITSDGLSFRRNGAIETVRPGKGDATDRSALRGKADCLIVNRNEGYCRY